MLTCVLLLIVPDMRRLTHRGPLLCLPSSSSDFVIEAKDVAERLGHSSLMLHKKIATRLTQDNIDEALAKYNLHTIHHGLPLLPFCPSWSRPFRWPSRD